MRLFTPLLLLSSTLLPFTSGARIQATNLTQTSTDKSRAQAIRASFVASYNDYKKYAYPADALLPLSEKGTGGFGNWQATVVDALSTALIMNETDLANEMIASIEKIDFGNTSQSTLSLFETNIRYLGGLLSAYELTGKKNKRFLQQATIVGDHLLAGWIGTNDIPFNTLQAWNVFGPPDTTTGAIIAEAGTLLLEMATLTRYTGNQTYLSHARRSMAAIVKTNHPLPGLPGQGIDPVTERPTDDFVTWEGGSDSYFEYLIKYAYLAGNSSSIFATEFIKTMQNSITSLLVQPQGHPDLLFLSSYSESNGGTIPRFSHLGCFAGGTWVLGGKILGQKSWVDYGRKLAYSCAQTYRRSVTGIGPESFVYIAPPNNTNGVTINDVPFYEKNGFNYDAVDYILRPEVSESVFYAYRSTGDPMWKDLNWLAYQNIIKYCKAPAALAGINEVNNTNTAQLDTSESFLYAELYKYLYLTFADPNVVHLDKFVLTTEGHPLQLQNPGAFKERKDIKSAGTPTMAAHVTSTSTKTSSSLPLPQYSNLPASVQGFISQVQNAAKGIYDAAGHKLAGISGSASSMTKRAVEEGMRMHKARKARLEQIEPVFRAQMN